LSIISIHEPLGRAISQYRPEGDMESGSVRILVLATAVGVLSPHRAGAQEQTLAAKEPFRRWDVASSVGFKFGRADDQVVPHADWDLELGRYWTPHLKTDFTITGSSRRVFNATFRNLPGGGFEWIQADPRKAGISAAATYQFLENVFAQPFVSAGIRVGWVDTIRYSYAPRVYSVTSDHLSGGAASRSFVGAGFKSYFDNGRAFMKSEFIAAFDPHSPAVTTFRIGFGVDF
jgi:hypothetical protein